MAEIRINQIFDKFFQELLWQMKTKKAKPGFIGFCL
jgi:hypothetical protein